MIYEFVIPGTLPTLNEYSNKERTNRFSANEVKKDAQKYVKVYIPSDAPHFTGKVTVRFRWVRPDMRCDKDNVAFAKKFILDALQEVGVIARDSWKLCTPYDIGFACEPKNPRIEVSISDEG